MNHPQPSTRLLRVNSVLEKVALSRTELQRQINDGTFPRPLKLGPRTIAWTEASIDAWIASLPEDDGKQ